MASSRNWHGGKGSVRRPGNTYEDNYDAIFGKKNNNTETEIKEEEMSKQSERTLTHLVATGITAYVLAICILAIMS